MTKRKEAVLQRVEEQRAYKRSVGEVSHALRLVRSTYYRLKQQVGRQSSLPPSRSRGTPAEKRLLKEVKEAHPPLRHRQLQGILQAQGRYLSASFIDQHLKARGQVEPYAH